MCVSELCPFNFKSRLRPFYSQYSARLHVLNPTLFPIVVLYWSCFEMFGTEHYFRYKIAVPLWVLIYSLSIILRHNNDFHRHYVCSKFISDSFEGGIICCLESPPPLNACFYGFFRKRRIPSRACIENIGQYFRIILNIIKYCIASVRGEALAKVCSSER